MLDSSGERQHVLYKIKVVEYYLAYGDGTAWEDNCEIMMLAGIKADVVRLLVRWGRLQ